MLQAILLGAAAQASLILSGLVVYWVTESSQVIGGPGRVRRRSVDRSHRVHLVPESSDLSHTEFALWLLRRSGSSWAQSLTGFGSP
jgi:hypothetical protein